MADRTETQHGEVVEGEIVERQIVRLEPAWPGGPDRHAVTELASPRAGALSPFGEDVHFPLPFDLINYEHPTSLPNR